ncbi:MAG TPA: response regulator [Elusimicrobiota bacterium]|nr:response regulator [Elusimicrobiota bacterium]
MTAKKILVIDDSPTMRSLHSYILKSGGFDVETAENGVMGIEKLYSDPAIVLCVVDINMPKMDGIQFIRTIRGEEQYRDLPVIVVTSEEEEKDRRRGLEAGANIYMVKPTQPEKLVMHVKMLLGV